MINTLVFQRLVHLPPSNKTVKVPSNRFIALRICQWMNIRLNILFETITAVKREWRSDFTLEIPNMATSHAIYNCHKETAFDSAQSNIEMINYFILCCRHTLSQFSKRVLSERLRLFTIQSCISSRICILKPFAPDDVTVFFRIPLLLSHICIKYLDSPLHKYVRLFALIVYSFEQL